MKKLVYSSLFVLAALSLNAQSPAIIFLQSDANVDCYEFMTLRRGNLNTMSIRDAGICSDDKFRTNENDILSFTGPSYTDVPAGTIFQVKNSGGVADSNSFDGRIYIIDPLSLNNTSTNPPGDQVIAYTGPAIGSLNCGGGTGTNTFISGFDWGNSGWTSGATSSNDSKAPGTPYDFAFPGAFNKNQFSGNLQGNEAALVAGINNVANWTGTTTGDGIISLKNILFDEPNYTTGAAVITPAQNSVTLNLTGLNFTNTTSSTRYAVTISTGPAQPPVDRYTCYTGIAPTVLGSPSVVISVSGQTADDFCGVIAQGSGQVVYLDYTLPSALTITGLAQTTTYNFTVVAVNGNGYTANFSSMAYSNTFTTQNPIVDNTEVNLTITPDTVTENVGQVAVVLGITNPSPSVATTVELTITGGTGSAADIGNFTTQTVTFPAGSSALQPVSIFVTDDALFEINETLNFAIRNISGGQGTAFIGADSTFTLTIIDDDIPNIVINEINYNPSETSGSPDAQYEFIELYNGEPINVDLGGYTFSQGVTYTFPANTIITPGQYIIVAIDAASYSGQGYDVYQWAAGDLSNSGETVEFKTAGNLLVDIVTYDEVAPWPLAANNTGPSLELIDEPLDNALAQNWLANGPKNGTPGHENTPLAVSENQMENLIFTYNAENNLVIKTNPAYTNKYTVTIFNLSGQNIGTYANLSGNNTINLNHLTNGLYFIQIADKQGVLNKKLYIGY